MAHFAQLNDDNEVLQVIVIGNDDCGGGDFPESEAVGQAFIASLGLTGTWKQTSYSNSFRKQYAGIGCTYDATADEFVARQPYPSWTLDENNDWQPPVPRPVGERRHFWDEDAGEWVAA